MTDVAPETDVVGVAALISKMKAAEYRAERAEEERDELRQAAAPFLSLWISPKAYHRLRVAITPEETKEAGNG